ncbi:MAG: phospho-sugar mutase [Clostridia bacterium]|nr:phospho-sugar mutase [Clostridia bacterium]
MRKTAEELYSYWLTSDKLDADTKAELEKLSGDTKEIEERFYRDLEFGTGGMRGILGAGTNRMNVYTVRRAAQGLAKYVLDSGKAADGVVIGYDTRYFSDTFAKETAKVLIANGIKAYLFETIHATPEVSFGIRYYKAAAGVMITASHNPKEYNGFKAYGSDGAQFPPEASDVIVEVVNSCDIFEDVKVISDKEFEKSPLLVKIGAEADNAFLDAVYAQSINPDVFKTVGDDFKVVYTPFHGTGLRPVTAIFERIGIKHVIVEPNQAKPDPAFSTVKSPNPEDKEGFTKAIELAKENGASLIIGTDPDADRVGVVVRDKDGEYQILTGNQTGALLCHYVLEAKKKKGTLTDKSVIIKTIVTSDASREIAKDYGVNVIDVFTGFKYIAEKIADYEVTGAHTYEFGFEESYGYLPGTYARDKDAVGAAMLIAEMAADYQTKGMTLYDGLMELYGKYGFFAESTVSVYMYGKDGMQQIADTMQGIRNNMPSEFGGIAIAEKEDYSINKKYLADGTTTEIGDFAASNVLRFRLADGKTFIAIRPSGTEPKIKLYFCTAADSKTAAESQIAFLTGAVRSYLGI